MKFFKAQIASFIFSLVTAITLFAAAPIVANAQNVNVKVSGPAGSRSQNLPTGAGTFDVNLPLAKNTVNKVTVSATDSNGNKVEQEISITQISFDSLIVAQVTAEPLPIERIEQLVADGVIDLADPENFNVSQFTIVLTIAQEPVSFSIPVVTPKTEPTGFETYKLPSGSGSGRAPQIRDSEVIVFEVAPPKIPGFNPPKIPGIIVIDGRIKTLKEFYSVKFLMLNTSGIFTLRDVNAMLEFPDGGLSNTLPLDGVGNLGDILPGDGITPSQAQKEFIIRGDDIGVRKVKVAFGGKVAGPGIPEGEEIPFNGTAETSVEVKGPPSFLVQVDHPDHVEGYEPYDLTIDITNTGDSPALYSSLDLDVGFDAELLNCGLDASGNPECVPADGPVTRSLGHILPKQKVRQVYRVNPFLSGDISSCLGISDQNITLQVSVGNIGCLVGNYPPNRHNSDGTPSVSVVPINNLIGVGLDSPVLAVFSKEMDYNSIKTGAGGNFNVYDRAGSRLPGRLRFDVLNGDSFVIWQFEDGITNRLTENMEYTVEILKTVKDNEGKTLVSDWVSKFVTTGEGFDDTNPPTLTLGVDVPVDPNNVLPGQMVKIQAYAADQGSGISRIDLRMKDLSVEGAKFVLIDKKNYVLGDKFPFIFTIDSKNLIPGHTYQLLGTAYDGAGNLQDATLALVIAETAPIPTVALPAGPLEVLQGVPLNVAPIGVTGGTFKVNYYLGAATTPTQTSMVAPYQLNLQTLTLAPGNYTIRAEAVDGLAQTGEAFIDFEVLQNNNGPTVNFASPGEGQGIVKGQPLAVSTTITDPVGIKSIVWRFGAPDAAPFATGVTVFNLTTSNLPLGDYTIYVEAKNNLDLSSGVIARNFSIIDPPPAPPPVAPTITNVTIPVAGSTTVDGTTTANRRVDVTNQQLALTTTVYSNGAGAFHATLDANSGQTIQAKVFDASQQNQSAAATALVPAPVGVESIDATPETRTFSAFGQTQQLIVTANLTGGGTEVVTPSATYTSSNPTVATVSNTTGLVVAQANGSATINVSYAGKTDTVAITVNVLVPQSLEVSPTGLTFNAVNQTTQLITNLRFSDNSLQAPATGVTYSTGNTNVAAVASTGIVTAKGAGNTLITVTRAGVPPVTVPVTVNLNDNVAPVVNILSPAVGTGFERGDTITVSVNATDDQTGVAQLTFSATGAATANEVRNITPSNNTNQNFSFNVPASAPIGATITVSISARDAQGNDSIVATRNLIVSDETAPTVSITAPAPTTAYNYGDVIGLSVSANDLVGVTQVRYQTQGAFSVSGSQTIASPVSGNAVVNFNINVPFGASQPELLIRVFARDAAGNEREATPVEVLITTADIIPPVTEATATSNPGSSTNTTVSYAVTDGLGDLDYVALYYRRNGIGTFNRYTNADGGNQEGKFTPQSGANGTILFDSTKMGGDGTYEFYTVGVDIAGNREEAPDDGVGGVAPDQQRAIAAGTVVTVINTPTVITAGDTTLDDKNLRVVGTTLTIDGTHSYRNVELLNGAVLTHSEATESTEPGLDITVWSLAIDGASSIDVNARGYLGGNRPGNAAANGLTVGNTLGASSTSAGSYGGLGSLFGGATNPTYGSLVSPAELGSGGSSRGGSYPGGDGGGRVKISAINIAADGAISANGAIGSGNVSGSGSGGSINIVTSSLSGAGDISANGGGYQLGAGGGRIAVFHIDLATKDTVTIKALGGVGNNGSGGNGTVFLKSLGEANGSLVIDGQPGVTSFTTLPIPPGFIFDDIVLRNNARVTVDSLLVVNNELQVINNSILTHSVGSEFGLQIQAAKVYVDATSSIDATGKGYLGGHQPGATNSPAGTTLHGLPGAGSDSAASYGGSARGFGGVTNQVYGSPQDPIYLGSGGPSRGAAYPGGNGGGRIEITATDSVNIEGAVLAAGAVGTGNVSGSGSGGSIKIETSQLKGTGTIAANGGGYQAAGGGGRVAIYYDFLGNLGNDLNQLRNITAFAGVGSNSQASAGTVYLKRSDQTLGDLYIDDNKASSTAADATRLTTIGFGTVQAVTADTITVDSGLVYMPNALVGLKLNPNRDLTTLYTVVANTADTITVDTTDKPTLDSIAQAGDSYSGDYRFDNVFFRRGGNLLIGDPLFVAQNLALVEYGRLSHQQVTTTFTPYLDLTVDSLVVGPNSSIVLDSKGYLGGYQGANANCEGRTLNNQLGSSATSAGSYGGFGANFGGIRNPQYGSLTDPSDFGSGGACRGGSYPGGNGGGYAKIMANNIVLDGVISANGAIGTGNTSGSGSGGTINIDTTTLDGSGFIRANGGGYQLGAGGGRIAIRYQSTLGLAQANIEVKGGQASAGNGGNGTVFLKSALQTQGDLVIDGFNVATPGDSTELPAGLNFDNLVLRNGARVVTANPIIVEDQLSILGGSILTHPIASEAGLDITARRVFVDETSSIDVSGRGYQGGYNSGNAQCLGLTLGAQLGAPATSGGSYGGIGGIYDSSYASSVYGHPAEPFYLGSGGACRGASYPGGNGGGRVTIATSDETEIDGAIFANGQNGTGNVAGSGSGGSVLIETNNFKGSGTISANGGGYQAGAGGGRVFVSYQSLSGSGENFDNLLKINAFGGVGSAATGSAGTVLLKSSTQAYGDLYIDDNRTSETSTIATPLTKVGFGTIQALTADTLTTDGGVVYLPSSLVGLRLNPDINQNQAFRIISNTANTITVDISGGTTLLDVAAVSDSYAGVYNFDNIYFRRGGYLEVGDPVIVGGTVDISGYSVLTHSQTTGTFFPHLDLTAGSVVVGPNSLINVDGRGYLGGSRPGNADCSGRTIGNALGASATSGASYGGLGVNYTGTPNPVYGSDTNPMHLGSGGACRSGSYPGGDGGGWVRIVANDVLVNGIITAGGENGSGNNSGSGSGGTINILTDSISGAGTLRANGGGYQTGGGGGRVAITAVSNGLGVGQAVAAGGVSAQGTGGVGSVVVQ